MSHKKYYWLNKVITVTIAVLFFSIVSTFIPRIVYQLQSFDAHVQNLAYVAKPIGELEIEILANREVRRDIPAEAIAELICRRGQSEYKVKDFQEKREYTYNRNDTNLVKFIERLPRVPEVHNADECRITYHVILHLPEGVEKEKTLRTNWFSI